MRLFKARGNRGSPGGVGVVSYFLAPWVLGYLGGRWVFYGLSFSLSCRYILIFDMEWQITQLSSPQSKVLFDRHERIGDLARFDLVYVMLTYKTKDIEWC